MLTNKGIIIVAADQYKDLARKLQFEISKKEIKAQFLTVKQFEATEPTLSGTQYVILLGNSDENTLTKAYLPIIGAKLTNRAGACFGYDGSKALVFGEGKLDQVEEFKNLVEELTSHPKMAGALAIFLSTFFTGLGVLTLTFAPFIYLSSKFIGYQAKKRKLLRHQTEVALSLFLIESFDQMAGIKKAD